MQEGTIFYTTALRELPLVHQQANKSITRLDITQDNTKRLKKIIPQDANNLIVEKKMVHRLLISLAHTAPIDHNYVPLPKVVHGKDLPYNHQILFHGKQNALITNKDVKAFWPMLRKCRGRFICLAREFFRGAGCLWVVRVGVAVEAPLELSFYAGKG
jgi:hypothetical protein